MASVRFLAGLLAALVLVAPASAGSAEGIRYLESRRQADGGFAEPGRAADPALTSWAVLGLVAAGTPPDGAADYLASKPYGTATDLELRIVALAALDADVAKLADELESLQRPDGSIGPLGNSTIWGVLALRAAGRPVPEESLRRLLGLQARNGGWSWQQGVAADTDDTAAALQALRAAEVPRNVPSIRRGVAYLRAGQNRDGGWGLAPGARSNAQSTAWAIQGLLAAGVEPGQRAFGYLNRVQQPDGSFRYSARFATTPVWVTSMALAALARRTYPLA
jgi:hypothetical protein